jgi:hypothetical protein
MSDLVHQGENIDLQKVFLATDRTFFVAQASIDSLKLASEQRL